MIKKVFWLLVAVVILMSILVFSASIIFMLRGDPTTYYVNDVHLSTAIGSIFL